MSCIILSSGSTNQVTKLTCNDPSASVFFDGVIPSVSETQRGKDNYSDSEMTLQLHLILEV